MTQKNEGNEGAWNLNLLVLEEEEKERKKEQVELLKIEESTPEPLKMMVRTRGRRALINKNVDELIKNENVVDAIHKSPELDIKFPETHEEQVQCARGFKAKSQILIDCCLGAIDGMLVWMNKPNITDQKIIGFGPAKFFCGRKMKYGLNMMGVCDSR